MPSADGAAARRARALLVARLDDDQRREYVRDGVVTVVRRGPVTGVVARHVGVAVAAAAVAALLPIPWSVALGLLVALPLLAPTFVLACLPRRVWRVDARRGPGLVLGSLRVDFCVRFEEPMPEADRVLAYKNVLEADEALFLRKANLERVRWPSPTYLPRRRGDVGRRGADAQ